jgi:hypothetical protein
LSLFNNFIILIKMKKIFTLVISMFVIGAVFCTVAFADTSNTKTPASSSSAPVLVASVNIYNAKVVSNTDRNYVISFDLSNDVGVQSQVKYSVQLVKTISSSSDILVDEYVYDASFSIDQNTTLPQTVNYSIPASIGKGDYKLWILSKNNSGLVLAAAYVGNVKITQDPSNTVMIDPESCYVTASSTKYNIGDTVYLSQADKFTMNCNVISTFTNDITLVPFFETRMNSSFGDLVSQVSGGSNGTITIKPGSNSASVELPKPSVPQSYTNIFSLASSDKKISTNKIVTNYSIDGDKGSILNIILDKTAYRSGDIAKVKIFSSVYLNPSGTSTISTSSVAISVIVNDSQGQSCSNKINQTTDISGVTEVSVPITKDCVNPKVEVSLSGTKTDGSNVILDNQNYKVTTPNNQLPPADYSKIMIASAVILFLFIIFIIIYRKKNVSVIKVIALLILSSGIMFGITGNAKAASYSFGIGVNSQCSYGYTVNLDKSSKNYNIGDNIVVTGTANWSGARTCNSQRGGIINTGIDLPTHYKNLQGVNAAYSMFDGGSNLVPPGNHNGSLTITNSTSEGTHNVDFNLYAYYGTNACETWGYACNIQFHWCCYNTWDNCTGWTCNDIGYRGENVWTGEISFTSVKPIILSFSVTPQVVLKGNPATVVWNAPDANKCSITKSTVSGGTVNFVNPSNGFGYITGSMSSGPINEPTTFIINCSNLTSTVTQTKAVVLGTPMLYINKSRSDIDSKIDWSAQYFDRCSLTDPSNKTVESGTFDDNNLNGVYATGDLGTYTLTCFQKDNSSVSSTTQITSTDLSPKLNCSIIQPGNPNIYLNKSTQLNIALPSGGGTLSNVEWKIQEGNGTPYIVAPGDPIKNITKVFTTIGPKTISAIAKLNTGTGASAKSENALCPPQTIYVKLAPATSQEI